MVKGHPSVNKPGKSFSDTFLTTPSPLESTDSNIYHASSQKPYRTSLIIQTGLLLMDLSYIRQSFSSVEKNKLVVCLALGLSTTSLLLMVSLCASELQRTVECTSCPTFQITNLESLGLVDWNNEKHSCQQHVHSYGDTLSNGSWHRERRK